MTITIDMIIIKAGTTENTIEMIIGIKIEKAITDTKEIIGIIIMIDKYIKKKSILRLVSFYFLEDYICCIIGLYLKLIL